MAYFLHWRGGRLVGDLHDSGCTVGVGLRRYLFQRSGDRSCDGDHVGLGGSRGRNLREVEEMKRVKELVSSTYVLGL